MEKERDGLGVGLRGEVTVVAKSVNAETACFPTALLTAFLILSSSTTYWINNSSFLRGECKNILFS
jgi:hypothetical protein